MLAARIEPERLTAISLGTEPRRIPVAGTGLESPTVITVVERLTVTPVVRSATPMLAARRADTYGLPIVMPAVALAVRAGGGKLPALPATARVTAIRGSAARAIARVTERVIAPDIAASIALATVTFGGLATAHVAFRSTAPATVG